MADKIKEIPQKALAWWNKFTPKQKTMIASIAIVVIIGLVILAKVITTPTMISVQQCANTKESSEVKKILDEADIVYKTSTDGLEYKVKAEDQAQVAILLGEKGIPATTYDIENVFSGGFSITEADKTKKYQLYLEEQLREHLESLEPIESATVKLHMQVDDGTILAKQQDTYASVNLSLTDKDAVSEEMASGLAKWLATAIGNDDTKNITIIDNAGNMLFMGTDSNTVTGSTTSQLTYRSKAENMVKSQVKEVVLGTNLYDNVSVGMNLAIDFDKTDVTDREFYTKDDAEHGPLDSERNYASASEGGVAGTPGTNANDDDTTYLMPDGTQSSQEVTDEQKNYKTSERITDSKGSAGKITYDDSSITVVANRYRIYEEDVLRESGELDDMTFDEFVAANREKVKMDVDPDFVQMVANTTGFPQENIMVVAYEVPFFEYANGGGKGVMDYLPVIIAALIMLMLGFVVFRSTRKEGVVETAPELSVESLLSSTKEAQENLENIGFTEKSETRVLIEKFVEENPQAAASLLRNWLNEEWD